MPNCRGLVIIALGTLLLHAPDSRSADKPASIAAQPGQFAIDVWESDNGLPQNSVIAMTQTRDGYLWLGTLRGLVRFDGLRFTVFDENNTPGLGNSQIVHLFEDSNGSLWIGTLGSGTVVLRNGQIEAPQELSLGGVERRLISACEGTDGAVWLSNANGEIWRYLEGRLSPFSLLPLQWNSSGSIVAEPAGAVWVSRAQSQIAIGPVTTTAGLPELPRAQELTMGRLDLLAAGRRNGYWRLADGGIQKWTNNRPSGPFIEYPWVSRSNPLINRDLTACEDAEGNLIVGTRGAGVFWMNADGGFTHLSTSNGLSHDVILSLCVDREGTLWVGTDGAGLNRVKRQVFTALEPTRSWTVKSVGEDARGGLWFGFNDYSTNYTGVGYWQNGHLQRFGASDGLTEPSVSAVLVDGEERVWIGTSLGLFQRSGLSFGRISIPGLGAPAVNALFQDRERNLWIGTRTGLARLGGRAWTMFTSRAGLSSDDVRAIAQGPDGSVWIGTEGGGLNHLKDGRFTVFRKDEKGLPADNISALHLDADGVLWVATSGGLARFHDGRWTRYTTAEGLASNGLGYLLEDEQGHLWIGSTVGLMRTPKKALNDFAAGRSTLVPCRTYGRKDGLPTGECSSGSQPAAVRSRDGTLWFPTIKGVAAVNPRSIRPNTNPPPVIVETVRVEGDPLDPGQLLKGVSQTVRVPPRKERLEITYTSLNLAAPDRARFRYRLEAHDDDWIEAGNVRVVRYKLSPGKYRFHVKAANEDGVWNEAGSSLAIIVEPPFWRTWWFLTVVSLCIVGLIAGIVHYISTQKLQRQLAALRQQEALEKERARIARDIHDQLGASLTQVALLGELVEADKDSPAEVEGHARQISQTARETTRTLDEIVWTVNPSNDTLEGLANYVCKYTQDYLGVAGIRYRLEVPPDLPPAEIQPEVRHNVFLAAKEAVTNIVRHAQAKSAWIRLRLEPDGFTFEIADDGRGLAGMDEKRAATRNGLRNMRKRMEDVGGNFAMTAAPEGGLLIRLSAPLQNH